MTAQFRLGVATQGFRGGTGDITVVPFTGETEIRIDDSPVLVVGEVPTVTSPNENTLVLDDSQNVIQVEDGFTIVIDDSNRIEKDC